MTYKELRNLLDEFSEQELEMDVTIYDAHIDEFTDDINIMFFEEDGILDEGHPFIYVNND